MILRLIEACPKIYIEMKKNSDFFFLSLKAQGKHSAHLNDVNVGR